MKNSIVAGGTVCVAALLTASSALADVTAADVWADWEENLKIYGSGEILIGSVTVNDAGNEITVDKMTVSIEDEANEVSTQMGPMVISENGDGTVSVTVPESYIASLAFGDEFAVDVEILQDNVEIIVSGDPDTLNYDVTADSYTIRVAEFKGEMSAEVTGDTYLTLNDISGSYQSASGEAETLEYSFESESADLLIDLKEPGGDNYIVFSGKMNGLNAGAAMDVPDGLDFETPETMFVDGFGFESATGYRSASFILDFIVDGDQGVGTLEMGQVGLHMAMDLSQLAYGFAFEGVSLNTLLPEMIFPLVMSWDTAATAFEVPASRTDDPQPFNFLLALTELTVTDDIWTMIDPAGLVPRDPVSIEVELAGMAKLFFDLFDPVQTQALAFGAVPGEIYALDLLNLRLAGAGAEVIGDGAFTFDNEVLDPVLGTPRPEGVVNIGIKGANTLIDTAVDMGLLPEDQATMGRLFMGMFTTPVGDDELSSKIEITSEGHILANGQRIQ